MNIHLIKSPEYETENLTQVYNLLNKFEGPMKFFMSDHEFSPDDFHFLRYTLYPEHNFQIVPNKKRKFITQYGIPLSWEELFILCKEFRKVYRIPKKDFVFLLTYRMNSLNWFSHIDKSRDSFIHTAEWEKFDIRAHHKYPVAYQVIENIFQNLLEIDVTQGSGECVHYHARGCINDFCLDKRQVILKLRTGDICRTCYNRMIDKKLQGNLINQIFQILEGLRTQFLFKKNIRRSTGNEGIVVNDDLSLTIPQIGSIELKLTPLYKALYIVYLMNPEGIRFSELAKHSDKLKELYKILNQNLRPIQISNSISRLTTDSSFFSQKKSRINQEIQSQLGNDLSENFIIKGIRREPFRIHLSPDNIDIRF